MRELIFSSHSTVLGDDEKLHRVIWGRGNEGGRADLLLKSRIIAVLGQ